MRDVSLLDVLRYVWREKNFALPEKVMYFFLTLFLLEIFKDILRQENNKMANIARDLKLSDAIKLVEQGKGELIRPTTPPNEQAKMFGKPGNWNLDKYLNYPWEVLLKPEKFTFDAEFGPGTSSKFCCPEHKAQWIGFKGKARVTVEPLC